VENQRSGLLLVDVLAADVAVEGQFQSGSLADRELLAGLRSFVVAVVGESAEDAVQSARQDQHVNGALQVVPATTAVFLSP